MNTRAGLRAQAEDLIDVGAVIAAYTEIVPNPSDPAQQVVFGTSGHRGSSLNGSFNEQHIIVICSAIARYRAEHGIAGPLFIGSDTHPLSLPAERTARKVLARAGVHVVASAGTGEEAYVPTPAISHAILTHNRDLAKDDPLRADGIVLTPSHNPPGDGGIKYNPPHGGPADTDVTEWIAAYANQLLVREVQAAPYEGVSERMRPVFRGSSQSKSQHSVDGSAACSPGSYDFVSEYVESLNEVIDVAAIREAGVRMAAHPLGGASAGYWAAIRDRLTLDLTVLGPGVDPQWSFMHLDWDGAIRMDPSSADLMETVTRYRGEYQILSGNDADADRHGIVTEDGGLMNPNHFLAAAIDYLLTHRPGWNPDASVGKTVVSSGLIDRVVASHGRKLLEVPVGFKWFVPGLLSGEVAFGGEESAGASFLRFDGTAWSTDKDGMLLALLAAEMWAVTGRSPSELVGDLLHRFGEPAYARVDRRATPDEKVRLLRLSPGDVVESTLAGDPITAIVTRAPGNTAPIGGLKVQTEHAWFAARPSGTEDVMKIYAESFRGLDHLRLVQNAANALVARVLA